MTHLPALRRLVNQRVVASLLIVVSVTLIIIGKVDQAVIATVRVCVADYAAPFLDMLSRPMSAVAVLSERVHFSLNLYRENARLIDENKRLLHWQQTALALADENAQLRDLLKLVPQSPVSFVSARVIARSGGAYLRNLMVDAGSSTGIARGQAAIAGEGLVGRVYEVGARAARILLLTDLNSRIPVVIERTRQRAILAGDNSPLPSLWYLDPAAPPRAGDRVVTAGEGGIFPSGLPVGVVDASDTGTPRVQPYVRLAQIEYVRIVNYGLADDLPAPVAARRADGRGPGAVAAKAGRR